jgi:hypothetical protein
VASNKSLISSKSPASIIREVKESLEGRLIGSQTSDQINMMILLLDEVNETKYYFDKMREGDSGTRNLIDLTKEQSRWVKMVEVLMKGFQELDKVEWDQDDLIKVTNYVLFIFKDILVKDFEFDESQLNRFIQSIKKRKEDIDEFVASVASKKR